MSYRVWVNGEQLVDKQRYPFEFVFPNQALDIAKVLGKEIISHWEVKQEDKWTTTVKVKIVSSEGKVEVFDVLFGDFG